MPSDCDKRIRQVLLEEITKSPFSDGWSGLSYVEKKHLVEELDPAFVRTELDKLQRRATWQWRFLWIAVALFVLLIGFELFLLDDGLSLFTWALPVILVLQAGAQYGLLQRRIMAYKVFAVLSGAGQPASEPAASGDTALHPAS